MRAANLVSTQQNEANMELSATISEANTNTPPVKMVLQDRVKSSALAGTFWQSFAKGFWAYTNETGKADIKTFEGLL